MNIWFHCRIKVKKILLKAFCDERVRKALDSLSHIRHTSTVFTVFTRTKKRTHSGVQKERLSERKSGKKDFKRSAEKGSLKSSRKERLSGRAGKKERP